MCLISENGLYKINSEGFTICTHTTSLSQDLTSDQKKDPQKTLKTLWGGGKGRTLQENNGGGSLARMDSIIDVM